MYLKSWVHEDIFIGLCYYAVDSLSYIPHKIKSGPGSFKVEELIDENLLSEDGDIHIYRIIKEWGVDSTQIIEYLRRYGAAPLGRKDKYADAIQYILSRRRIRRRGFEYIGSISRDTKASELHIGNRFEIVVELEDARRYRKDLEEIVLEKLLKSNIPNYYSYQRFGVFRVNHIRGYRFIREMSSISKEELGRDYTKRYGGRDIARLLINGFQAYIFNQSLNISIKKRRCLPKTKYKISLKKIDGDKMEVNAYPVLGYSLIHVPPELEEILKRIGIALNDLKRLLYRFKYLGIDVYGDLRPVEISFLENPEIEFNDNRVRIKFSISRGQYATQVLREVFKPRYPSRQGY